MRAIEYSVTGDPDVLSLVERPVPDPGPGEVRVRIHRSGVNPTDWKTRRGQAPGVAVHPPQVPNQDGSGVVEAVGQGVESALVGLRVWVWEAAHQRPAGGTAQEYAVVPARHVVLLPDVASFDLGASLGVPFLTAHRCLTATEPCRASTCVSSAAFSAAETSTIVLTPCGAMARTSATTSCCR